MKFETKMNFPNYSEKAMGQVVEQAPGKPFFERSGSNQRQIGTIVSATRIGSSSIVLFEVEAI